MSGGERGGPGCAGPGLCCVSVTALSRRYITCAEYTQFYGGKKAGEGGRAAPSDPAAAGAELRPRARPESRYRSERPRSRPQERPRPPLALRPLLGHSLSVIITFKLSAVRLSELCLDLSRQCNFTSEVFFTFSQALGYLSLSSVTCHRLCSNM